MTQRNCDDCYFSKLEGKKEPCKSCKATDDGFTNFREVPLTNADHIRAMSDEELVNVVPCPLGFSMFRCPIERQCGPCKREWLKQPAEEDGHV